MKAGREVRKKPESLAAWSPESRGEKQGGCPDTWGLKAWKHGSPGPLHLEVWPPESMEEALPLAS